MDNQNYEEKIFVGRDTDISRIIDIYDYVKEYKQPKILNIIGESGFGKTRLVQEFYIYIAKNYDDFNFWDHRIINNDSESNLLPNQNDNTSYQDIPWYWFSISCYTENTKITFLNQLRNQVNIYFGHLMREINKKKATKGILKKTANVLSGFVVPGGFESIETVIGLFQDGHAILNDSKKLMEKDDTKEQLEQKEYKSIVNQIITLLEHLFEMQDVPVIFIIDDLHWADRYTLQFVIEVLNIASKNRWPLLIISTSWPHLNEPLEQHLITNLSFIDRVYEKMELRALSKKYLIKLVKQYLTIDKRNAGYLTTYTSGDIELLHALIHKIKSSRKYLNNKGILKKSLYQMDIGKETKTALIRQRFFAFKEELLHVVMIASSSGEKFSLNYIREIMNSLDFEIEEEEVMLLLNEAIKDERIILSDNDIWFNFKRYIYFKVANDLLEDHYESEDIFNSKVQFYSNLFKFKTKEELKEKLSIQFTEKLESIPDFIDLLCRKYQINDIEKNQLNEFSIAYSEYCLNAGLFEECVQFGMDLKNVNKNYFIEDNLEIIISNAIQAAYLIGDEKREYELIMILERYITKDDIRYILKYSNYLMRVSKVESALELLERVSTNDDQIFLSSYYYSQLVTLYFYNGNYNKANSILNMISEKKSDIGDEYLVKIYHNQTLLSHNYDLNFKVIYNAEKCIQLYSELGDTYNWLISKINYADAKMATGEFEDSLNILEEVISTAEKNSMSHVLDMAYLCKGNTLLHCNRYSEAFYFYELGYTLARDIKHDWDAFYGLIWKEYGLIRNGYRNRSENLLRIYEEFSGGNYTYLNDLCQLIMLIDVFESKIMFDEIDYSFSQDNKGIYACSLIIKDLLKNQRKNSKLIESYLLECEGIKFCHEYINLYFDQEDFRDTDWYAKYIVPFNSKVPNAVLDKIVDSTNLKIRPCKMTCEGMCCYDGVYVSNEEEILIQELVNSNPEIFNRTDYFVDGYWNGKFNGRKTNTYAHNYQSEGYPEHFTATRCVFSDDKGLCILQAYALNNNYHPWKYKPKACWLHPLELDENKDIISPYVKSNDPNNLGKEYPGYTSYTQCGLECDKGLNWKDLYEQEINYYYFTKNK